MVDVSWIVFSNPELLIEIFINEPVTKASRYYQVSNDSLLANSVVKDVDPVASV
jgi:hypothetical protein